jgi:hypothetical protein
MYSSQIVNAQKMIEDCLNVLNIARSNGGPGYNKWERDFIESVDEQLNTTNGQKQRISDRQYNVLEKLWNKI